MKKQEVKVDDRVFIVRELLAREYDMIDYTDRKQGLREEIKTMTGMSDTEYNELTFKERLAIQKACNSINGVGQDFQNPTKA